MMNHFGNYTANNRRDKFGEELNAAVALTTLGVPSAPLMSSVQLPEVRQLFSRNHHQAAAIRVAQQQQRQKQQQQQQSLLASYPPSYLLDSNTTALIASGRKPKHSNIKRNFPQKLFDLLQTGFHVDIVKWLPGGTAFIVLDKRRFTNEILPNYFKDSQYTSFTRKLSRWKFTRVSRGPYIGAYFHKHFRSDNRSLCKLMSCNDGKSKIKTVTTTIKAEGEPAKEEQSVAEKTSEATDEALPVVEEVQTDDDASRGSVVAKEETKEEEEQHSPPSPITPASSSAVEVEAEADTKAQTQTQASFPVPAVSSGELRNDHRTGNDHDFLEQAFQLQNSMQNTNNSIRLIKQQLMEIRLRKAQMEERKNLLMLQAEADRLEEINRIKAEANRLRDLNRIKNAISMAAHHQTPTESHIIVAAARALERCNNIMDSQPSSSLSNGAFSLSSWPLETMQRRHQNNSDPRLGGGNRRQNEDSDLNSRAFAA